MLTSEITLKEKNCFFPFLITMINTALCVAVAVTVTVIANKTLRGYNLALILFQQSLHFMVYPLTLTLRS